MTDAKIEEVEQRYRRVVEGELAEHVYAEVFDESQSEDWHNEDAHALAREWVLERDAREADEREGAKAVDFDWLNYRFDSVTKHDGKYYCDLRLHQQQTIHIGISVLILDTTTRSQVLHLLAALGMEKKQ